MQWNDSPGGGFTSGTPWEPLNADWQTTNVVAQDADDASLLNLYRRFIHLRGAHPALGTGELLSLSTSDDAVAAYLRRDGSEILLVIANLGARQLSGIALAAPAGVLPPGSYAAADLLGGPVAAALQVSATGGFSGYVPLPALAPLELHVLSLSAVER